MLDTAVRGKRPALVLSVLGYDGDLGEPRREQRELVFEEGLALHSVRKLTREDDEMLLQSRRLTR